LENGHECNRDHGEANGTLRGVMRQFRGFRNERHHHQIGANDGDVLKPECQEMWPRRCFVQRINQFARPLRHADFLPRRCHFNHVGFCPTGALSSNVRGGSNRDEIY
jgi:hypothetical protein